MLTTDAIDLAIDQVRIDPDPRTTHSSEVRIVELNTHDRFKRGSAHALCERPKRHGDGPPKHVRIKMETLRGWALKERQEETSASSASA